jgi:7,8-dihydropterin-6-yl-methyl-4-(beta-D-ribofuranosyl)aminobenzene 5'-phosphate synthase
MKITIVYDNVVSNPDLAADWGFACLVETERHTLLFDTGAKGAILLDNMEKLNIDPAAIDAVFISHSHWDHTGGLDDLLRIHATTVFLPAACPPPENAAHVVSIDHPVELFENGYSTGQLAGIEQSLVIRQQDRAVVVAGCSHPGVGAILEAASRFGTVTTLIGGLHGFNEFSLLDPLETVCPAHCTQHIDEIKQRYPEKALAAGAGRVIEI